MAEKIRVVTQAGMEDGPSTPGMVRKSAFTSDNIWMGEVRTEAGTTSGWHHHGDHTTYGTVVSGRLCFEFGPGGRESVEAGPGEFFMVPPHTVHREGNPGTDEHVLIGIRVGQGPSVINVDGPDPD